MRVYEKLLSDMTPVLRQGRPGDSAHIKSAFANAQRFCKRGVHNPRVLFPAVILHDIGFGLLRRQFIPLVAGGKKSKELTHSITGVSSAYAAHLLPSYGFTPDEIKAIRFCLEYGDEETLSVKNPPAEMVMLHDLNFLDRFFPHRVRVARINRTSEQLREILNKSLAAILSQEIKEEAKRRYASLKI
ncbi:hypothetical protein HY627_00585 [Candidatus Uhrbacteria bacterium]|nr:hypothetical protein [Candidatus Uhrbacteria bacterium]